MSYDQLKNELIENFESDIDISLLDIVRSTKDEYAHYTSIDKYCNKDIYIDELDGTENIGDCIAIIDFQKKTTIPPAHSVVIKVGNNPEGKKLFLKYHYRYKYIAELALPTDILLPKILIIMRTIFWINKCRNEHAEIMKKRFAKIRFANELQYWNDLFLISEGANGRYTEEFEAWIDTQLSNEQKIAQATAYELFWDGTPHEHRHFIITSF